MDSRLIADIKQSEGCKLTAYKDSLGFWTIGYGHLLGNEKDWTGYKITQKQASALLEDDLGFAQTKAQALLEWKSLDTPCRQNAVIELVFNMGDKWKQFAKTRLDIQNKNWQAAHDDLLDSLWAKQVGATRSNRIATYLLQGEY
jgi:lysozyme